MRIRKRHFNPLRPGFAGALLLVAAAPGGAQIPRINTFFPIGGKAGSTVDVEIRGANLSGADSLLVSGAGVTGTVEPGSAKVDETFKPVWQAKCASCHELRSPANRSMTPAQWAATVERMVKVRQAPLSADEADKVTKYLQSAARAGRITAQITIAPDVLPGLVELRVGTPHGVSTVGLFEVGALPEVMGANGKFDQAQPITLPCVANGTLLAAGERHYFKFHAAKGQRCVFNLKGFRYSESKQEYFNPNLRLYDMTGRQLVENHGYYDLDPLIDWNSPADGDYVLEVRDLVGRGNPGSVYRLTMGTVPYDTVAFPPAAQTGSKAGLHILGKNLSGNTNYTLTAPMEPGLTQVAGPFGPVPLVATPYPVYKATDKKTEPVALPCGFAGHLASAGAADTFLLQGKGRYELETYALRVGSAFSVHVRLLQPDGSAVAETDRDGRIVATLDPAHPYTLKVENTGHGDAGSDNPGECVYFIEVRPAEVVIAAEARGETVMLHPGSSARVEVVLTRREGVEGDVLITAENLPPGVTAAPAPIPPDRNTALLILTAAPDAKPAAQPFEIVATAGRGDIKARERVTPLEVYRMNNQDRYVERRACIVSVCGRQDFTASIATPEPVRVHPKQGVPVKVQIQRQADFKGAVTVFMEGLPSGWVANPETVPADKNEVTLLVRPDGNDTRPFYKRGPKWTPIRAVVLAASDEYRFVVGTLRVDKADYVEDEKSDR